jgi:hypothetical protein
MSKRKNDVDHFDSSVVGFTELSGWPKEPGFPEEIVSIIPYRDGGTVGVVIKGRNGKDIDFFFDRILGRLCYGEYETKSDAAYIKKNSPFEREVYEYFEAAKKRLNTHVFSLSDIETFNECFQKAKVYSGVRNA